MWVKYELHLRIHHWEMKYAAGNKCMQRTTICSDYRATNILDDKHYT